VFKFLKISHQWFQPEFAIDKNCQSLWQAFLLRPEECTVHTGRLSGAAAVLIENRAMKYGTGTNVLQVTVIELIDAAK
jgi:hypothetical protein